MRGSLFDRGDAARRAHHERRGQAGRRGRLPERREIPGDDRPEIRVHGRRRCPFVLAELGRHLVRGDDADTGEPAAKLVCDGPLVARVPECEEQADRDRFDVLAEVRERREIEGLEHPFGPDPLAYAERPVERHQRLRVVVAEPVQVRPVLSPHVQKVLEACSRYEGGARPLALEEGVRRCGRAVREPIDPISSDGAGGSEDGLLLPRGGRHLGGRDRSVRDEDGVREGTADVDAQDRHAATLVGRMRQGPDAFY